MIIYDDNANHGFGVGGCEERAGIQCKETGGQTLL